MGLCSPVGGRLPVDHTGSSRPVRRLLPKSRQEMMVSQISSVESVLSRTDQIPAHFFWRKGHKLRCKIWERERVVGEISKTVAGAALKRRWGARWRGQVPGVTGTSSWAWRSTQTYGVGIWISTIEFQKRVPDALCFYLKGALPLYAE